MEITLKGYQRHLCSWQDRQKKHFFSSPYKDSFVYISSIFRQYVPLGLMNATLRNKALYFGGGDILISNKSDIFVNFQVALS